MAEKNSTPAVDEQPAAPIQHVGIASQDAHEQGKRKTIQAVYDRFTYIPSRCRYDPQKPFKFSMGLNVLFGETGILYLRLLTHTLMRVLNILQHLQVVSQ